VSEQADFVAHTSELQLIKCRLFCWNCS